MLRRLFGGSRSSPLFFAGVKPVGGYGAEVTGMCTTALSSLRRMAVQSWCSTRCSNTAWQVLEGDPVLDLATAAARRYATEVWQSSYAQGAFRWPALQDIFRVCEERGPPRSWRCVRGPIGAMQLELSRLGWRWVAPGAFADHEGRWIRLDQVSPAHLLERMRQCRQEQLEALLGAKTGVDHPIDPRPLQHVLASRKVDPRAKAVLRHLFTGAVCTKVDLVAMGYEVDNLCPKCGLAEDTLHHRLWVCADPEVEAVRSTFPFSLVEAARAEAPHVSCMFRCRRVGEGLPFPVAGHILEHCTAHRLVDEQWQSIGLERLNPDWVRSHNVHLFTDGSCVREEWAGSQRAGWGVVGVAGGRLAFEAYGPVPAPQPQTAPAAEWCAAWVASLLWGPSFPPPVGDCLGVVRALNDAPRRRLQAGGMHAGLLRGILVNFKGPMPMRKVKAHRSEREAATETEREDILGNTWADAAARLGAAVHPQPSPAESQEARSRWSILTDLASAAAQLSMLWPTARRMFGGRLARAGVVLGAGRRKGPRPPPPPPIPFSQQHEFTSIGGGIVCFKCLARARTWQTARRRELGEKCLGEAPFVRQVLDSQTRGHTLAVGAFSGQPVFICIKCGGYASVKMESLAKDCKEALPGSKGKQAINRFFRGEHPDLKRKHLVPEAHFRVLRGAELQIFTPGAG